MTKDELQAAWDEFLIRAFFKAPGIPMARIAQDFELRYSVTWEEFSTLKRIPRLPGQGFRITACRWVCGYIPKLGAYLWKHESAPIEALAKKLTASKLDSLVDPVETASMREDKKLKYQSRREVIQSTKDRLNRQKLNEAFARRSWSTVK